MLLGTLTGRQHSRIWYSVSRGDKRESSKYRSTPGCAETMRSPCCQSVVMETYCRNRDFVLLGKKLHYDLANRSFQKGSHLMWQDDLSIDNYTATHRQPVHVGRSKRDMQKSRRCGFAARHNSHRIKNLYADTHPARYWTQKQLTVSPPTTATRWVRGTAPSSPLRPVAKVTHPHRVTYRQESAAVGTRQLAKTYEGAAARGQGRSRSSLSILVK